MFIILLFIFVLPLLIACNKGREEIKKVSDVSDKSKKSKESGREKEEPKSEPKSEPKPEPKSEPITEPKPEPQPEPQTPTVNQDQSVNQNLTENDIDSAQVRTEEYDARSPKEARTPTGDQSKETGAKFGRLGGSNERIYVSLASLNQGEKMEMGKVEMKIEDEKTAYENSE